MKLTRILTTACAASALLFTSCDKDTGTSGGGARSEKEALADFKKSADELNAMTKEDPAPTDPMAGMVKMKAIMAKVKAINTDGLPADLKEAFINFRNKLSEMADVVKDMPEKAEDRLAWAQKMMADPALGQKMDTLGQEVATLGEKMGEVAKKYGIDADVGK